MSKLKVFLTSVFLLFVNVAYASDPFSSGTKKAEAFLEIMTGKLAIAILGIVVGLSAWSLMMGWIDKKRAWQIGAGAVILYSAPTIAAWFMS